MASELEKAVTDLLTRVVDGIDGATAFVEAELPEFITQLLLWHGLSKTVYGVILSGVAIWLLGKTAHVWSHPDDYDEGACVFLVAGLLVVFSAR